MTGREVSVTPVAPAAYCLFKGCQQPPADPATGKCHTHKHRLQCATPGCMNQAYARQLCVRHGGKRLCRHPSCTGNARSHGYCCRHGGKSSKKMCEEEGCTNVAHARQRCVRHGGGRKCQVADCTSYSRYSGYCQRHYGQSRELLQEQNQSKETNTYQHVPCAWKDVSTAFPSQISSVYS